MNLELTPLELSFRYYGPNVLYREDRIFAFRFSLLSFALSSDVLSDNESSLFKLNVSSFGVESFDILFLRKLFKVLL